MNLRTQTERLESMRDEITAWMKQKRSEVPIPVYGSVDVRDAGWKIGVVDANHFPAGFNNVSKENLAELSTLFKDHINRTHPDCSWVHIYPESHTRNQGYVENIATIKAMIETAGYTCTVGSPDLNGLESVHGISGPLMLTDVALNDDDELIVDGTKPDLILLNNDLTDGDIPGVQSTNITPPPHMGWYRRRKSQHYEALRPYILEMAELIDIDPWHLMPDWFVSEDKCLTEEACRIKLAGEIDDFLNGLREKYRSLGIEREPTVVIKNDSGTYGLGVMMLTAGEQILNLSNRKRTNFATPKEVRKWTTSSSKKGFQPPWPPKRGRPSSRWCTWWTVRRRRGFTASTPKNPTWTTSTHPALALRTTKAARTPTARKHTAGTHLSPNSA